VKDHLVYFSLGSNLGDRQLNLVEAMTRMTGKIGRMVATSRIYETAPWGFESEHAFYNCCIGMKTPLDPLLLMEEILRIETSLGRKRTEGGYADRRIDIDILFYDDLVLQHPRLVLPHPSLEKRRFVLTPLSEIAPGLIHPVSQCKVSQLLEQCADPHPVSVL
jgi:2-amino-4-hydroxy-6-hydroxymethyldihydropteridine diphosphokinase